MPSSPLFSKRFLLHSCHSYLLISPFENLLFSGTSAEAHGYLWFSKRKGAFQMTHSKTVRPCVKIRLYRTAHGSKSSSFATDKAVRGGLGCKLSTFSSKTTQLLKVQKAEFQDKLYGAICFHQTLLMTIQLSGSRICYSKTGQNGYGKRYFHSSKAEKQFFIFSDWIQLKKITAGMIAFGSLEFDL